MGGFILIVSFLIIVCIILLTFYLFKKRSQSAQLINDLLIENDALKANQGAIENQNSRNSNMDNGEDKSYEKEISEISGQNTWIIYALLAVAVCSLAFAFFSPYIFSRNIFDKKVFDFETTGQIGDTVGGLTAPFLNLTAILVTGLAFYMQYRANQIQLATFRIQLQQTKLQFQQGNDKQTEELKRQQFEAQFYEMLRLHKENVNEMEMEFVIYNIQNQTWEKKLVSKREVFSEMNDFLNRLLGYVQFDLSIDQSDYNAAYEMFFWGFSENTLSSMNEVAQRWFIRDETQVDPSWYDFSLHKGFASTLGHYFRHLFLMVKFVVESPVISIYEDKMAYLKFCVRNYLITNKSCYSIIGFVTDMANHGKTQKTIFSLNLR